MDARVVKFQSVSLPRLSRTYISKVLAIGRPRDEREQESLDISCPLHPSFCVAQPPSMEDYGTARLQTFHITDLLQSRPHIEEQLLDVCMQEGFFLEVEDDDDLGTAARELMDFNRRLFELPAEGKDGILSRHLEEAIA